ncbi:MAG: beta-lactamase family protein [Planctomycetes bacterium]|nr:beta-lactamase family protein [Planctomycetota bacterium]
MPASHAVPDWSKLRASIEKRMLDDSVPGFAVAVARGGRILWEEGFGFAQREQQIPATSQTLFSLASISKPIATTALMLLHQRGQVDLDRPANDYLGAGKITGRAGAASGATLRRIANHTSGLPMHWQFFYPDEAFPRPPMDETIRRYAHLVSRPGERSCYCNLGFGILDEIVARVSGKSFADFLRQEIFLPLGMPRTALNFDAALAPYVATRYAPDGAVIPFFTTDHPGASEVFSSARDLIRFALFHLKAHLPDQKPILTAASIDEMQRVRVAKDIEATFGVGWRVNRNHHGHTLVGHGGGMGGVSTQLLMVPAEGCAVATLCNTNNKLPHEVAEEVLSALLPRYGSLRAAALKKEAARKKAAAKAKPKPAKLEGSLRGHWKGTIHTYSAELPFALEVLPSGEVHARIGEQLKALVNGAKSKDGWLEGTFLGDLKTQDLTRRRYTLQLNLKRRGRNRLNGAVLSISNQEHCDGAPATHRPASCLAHWTKLTKQR